MASWTDRFIDGMFSGRVNPKDGYAVAECKDPRVKRVLEFLVLLLYSEKPTRVTITVGNTIFGALSGECEHYRQYRRLVVLFFLVFSKFLLDISSSRVKRWQTRFILS